MGDNRNCSSRTPKGLAMPLTSMLNRSPVKPVHVILLWERRPETRIDNSSETRAEERMRASIFSLPHVFIVQGLT